MKKLSVLIAMLLCVTIGGVYAAWTYAGTNDIADSFAEAKVTIADVELLGANGVYTVESNLVLTVDQANEQHDAKLVFGSNNNQSIYLTVKFTPSVNAPINVKRDAVPSEVYFGLSTPMQYKMDADGNYSETGTPKDIFTLANTGNGIIDTENEVEWVKWIENEQGEYVKSNQATDLAKYFTCTFNVDWLQSQIKLNDNEGDNPFVLDTKAEHDAFRTALGGNIVIRISDGTVNN